MPLLLLLLAAAQQAPAPEPMSEPVGGPEEASDEVVVQARRQPGAVVGDITPEVQLSPADIRSYGVSSVAELLDELAPQTRSGRGSGGAPVVLLGGRRISSFAEIRDLPTEAIVRVDILPEEVALKYGYRADQRVVNIVLRRRFDAVVAELDARVPTEGGRFAPEAEGDLTRIRAGRRTTLHLEYRRADALTEAERDIRQGTQSASIGGNVRSIDGSALGPTLGSVAAVPAIAATRPPATGDFGDMLNTTDQARFRTLLPATQSFNANGVYATSLFGAAAAFNARVEHDVSDARRGLPSATLAVRTGSPFSPFAVPVEVTRAFDAPGALRQHNRATSAHLGAGFNGDAGRWRWTLTANADHDRSDTRTQTGLDATAFQARLDAFDPLANPYAALDLPRAADNVGRSRTTVLDATAVANGPLFALPAGDAGTTIRAHVSSSDFSSRSLRSGVASAADIGRDLASGQINLDLPVARRNVALSWLGNLSLNGNVAVEKLSDAGTLWTFGYGANWSPVPGVRLLWSATHEDNAPAVAQLGNPVVFTPGVRVFDYVAGTTATVTTVAGGNPVLVNDEQTIWKLGLDVKPWSARDIGIVANYVNRRTDDPIAAFPSPTAAIEAAFPDRFVRDADGRLLRLDSRPINFARTARSELRYGINMSFRLTSDIQRQLAAFRAGSGPDPLAGARRGGGRRDRPERPDGSALRPPAPDAPSAVGRGGGGRRFGGNGPGGAGGRVQFALYHTWNITSRVLVADGGPALNLLDGDAIGQNGGAPRHELEGQAGYSNDGLGARASLAFRSATRVNGGTPASPETLDFGSLTTVNLRLFADLGQRPALVRAHPWLRGVRLTLAADNLFNRRQRVTDAGGTTPIGFQPGYLDPLGRSIRVAVRKLFF